MKEQGNSGYPVIQPDQFIEGEWTDDYIIQNLRWIAFQYNTEIINPNFSLGGANTDSNSKLNTRFVTQYLGFLRYYFGWQYNTDYEWANQDDMGEQTRVPMWRGNDMTKMLNYCTGVMRAMFMPLPKIIKAVGISENVISKRKLEIDLLKRIVDNKNALEYGRLMTGIDIVKGVDDLDITDKMQVEKFEKGFQHSMETSYKQIAKDFLYRNNYLTNFIKAGQYSFIGGRCVFDIYEKNGKVYFEVVPPEEAIVDMSRDDDQHLNDSFGGRVKYMSIPEILARWKFSAEETKELQEVAKNGGASYPFLVPYPNMNWYTNYGGRTPKVAVVFGKWRSVTRNKGVPVECIREGALIANKYLRDSRICPYSVVDKYDKSKKRLGFVVGTPNTFLGTNLGICGLFHKYIDLKNLFMTQLITINARALGRIVVVNENKLPEGVRTPELLSQIKQTGIITTNSSSEDGNTDTRGQRPIDVIDATLDPSISQILNQIQYIDEQLNDVINIPRQARGQDSGSYASKAQLATILQQSNTGVQWFYGSLLDTIKNSLEVAVELQKTVAPTTGKEYLSVIIGDTASDLISMDVVRELLENDFKLYFDFKDELDDSGLEVFKQMTMQSASINPDALLDYVALTRMDNLNDAQNYLEYKSKQRIERMKEEQQAQMENAQENAKINANAQENIAAMQSDTKMASDSMAQENLIAQALLDKGNTNNNK